MSRLTCRWLPVLLISGLFAFTACGDDSSTTDPDAAQGGADGSVLSGDASTFADLCEGVDCSAAGDGICTFGVCDPGTGECVAQNRPDGAICDDSNLCTDISICLDGMCLGIEKNCLSAASGTCGTGICDTATGACLPSGASPVGTSCSGGNFPRPCRTSNVCTEDGTCGELEAGVLLYEDFSGPSAADWTYDLTWGVGNGANIQSCAGVSDVDCDSTPDGDIIIGEGPGPQVGEIGPGGGDNLYAGHLPDLCLPNVATPKTCMTSPMVDTTSLGSVLLSFHMHFAGGGGDLTGPRGPGGPGVLPPGFPGAGDWNGVFTGTVEVFNGTEWIELDRWTNFGPIFWEIESYNLDEYSNAALQVRFCDQILVPAAELPGSAAAVGGLNVDDIYIGLDEEDPGACNFFRGRSCGGPIFENAAPAPSSAASKSFGGSFLQ